MACATLSTPFPSSNQSDSGSGSMINVEIKNIINNTMNSLLIKYNEQASDSDEMISQATRTLPLSLNSQIKDKYKTFTRFNYRLAIQQAKTARRKKKQIIKAPQVQEAFTNFLINTLTDIDNNNKDKKKLVVQQLAGIKSQRRERFKKVANSYQILKHYIQKQHFKPRQQELYLMKCLAELKEFSQQNNLDTILRKIYKFMNEAVDLNELRFLCLLIMLAGDICFQFKDFNRAFYFYNQARNFSSYSSLHTIKAESLVNLGLILMEMKYYKQAVIFLKKGLQYAWKTKNIEQELLIYDYLGCCYYYQGEFKNSKYYHHRFTQGQVEQNDSAIKRISIEMLDQYDKYLGSMEKNNLTSLFLQYINIPIVSLDVIAPPKSQRNIRSFYDNYDQEGHSPRKKKRNKTFQFQDFPDVAKQIDKLLKEDKQFQTQIPSPDVQRNFTPIQIYGKPRKNVVFQQSAEYHKISGDVKNKIDLGKLHSNSFQKRLEHALTQKQNPDWWPQMKDKLRKNQLQKVGQLRERIRNSHQSYIKYPEQRRRAYSLKIQKIRQSFNKTLLDWIDPTK